jgi:surface polysaccharide O-acyltransferase-like enzyme
MTQKIPQLDAVRGIAILLVLIHNTDAFPSLHLEAICTYGWMGVDLFFVLSGFLITGILLEAKQSESYFKNFSKPVNWGLQTSKAVLTAPANRPPASPSSPLRWEVHPVP